MRQIEVGHLRVGFMPADVRPIPHGREGPRQYYQMPDPKTLPGLENGKGLKTIGVVFHSCVRQRKETLEARDDISSIPAMTAAP